MARSNRFDLGEPMDDDLGLDVFVPKPVQVVSAPAKAAAKRVGEELGFTREPARPKVKAETSPPEPSKPAGLVKLGRRRPAPDGPRAQITLSGSAATLQRFIDRAESEGITYVELIDIMLTKVGQGRLTS